MRSVTTPRSVLVPDDHALCFQSVAQARGIETEFVMGSRYRHAVTLHPWLKLAIGAKQYFFAGGALLDGSGRQGDALGRFINHPAHLVVRDKARTQRILAAAGLCVPAGRSFNRADAEQALRFAATLGGPVCVKPNAGSHGVLTFPGRESEAAVAAAFQANAAHVNDVLVEQSVPGEMIRYFYVHPRAVAVKTAHPAAITGDGVRTVAALIAAKNAERRRRALPGHPEIPVDTPLTATLAEQGYGLSSVPAAEATVLLRLVSNGVAGGESVECAARVHPSYRDVAEAACAAVPGLVVSAVDMKVLDCTQPERPGNYWILELNSNPGVLPYHHPWEGRPQDVCGAVIDFLARY